jgi:hypothetical protein
VIVLFLAFPDTGQRASWRWDCLRWTLKVCALVIYSLALVTSGHSTSSSGFLCRRVVAGVRNMPISVHFGQTKTLTRVACTEGSKSWQGLGLRLEIGGDVVWFAKIGSHADTSSGFAEGRSQGCRKCIPDSCPFPLRYISYSIAIALTDCRELQHCSAVLPSFQTDPSFPEPYKAPKTNWPTRATVRLRLNIL